MLRHHHSLPGLCRYLFVPAAMTALMLPGHKATANPDRDREDIAFVMLSDPFSKIVPPEPPKAAPPRPVAEPAPEPAPAPLAEDASFDERMDAFEERMEAFAESMENFDADMDVFGELMGDWGEEMGEYGEKMGAVGEALGEVAEDCADHQEDTAEPAIITARIEDSSDRVRIVCARGGGDRYMDADIADFVSGHPNLTDDEKATFLKNRKDPSRSYSD